MSHSVKGHSARPKAVVRDHLGRAESDMHGFDALLVLTGSTASANL